ncbi:site-specific integrase [Ramlibacter monticola]|uniref:Tyrosine-type recombinase/integrase n=1 Tax=Ramlibacter monticola TaxID=1926872 RepID=A0A936Z6H4_9BURK|nr:site-specific integrase [Ramlibacter monticola]MBL0394267.1 tyrosine-type recombinase/integrase [Ramlibacter monticola]
MARAKTVARLHLLTVKQIQNAGEGDHSDGGGLLLRIRGASSAWVFRFTAPSGRRREMGLGVAHRSSAAQAGESITAARRQTHEARELLRQGSDPIDAREGRRAVAQAAEQAKKASQVRERWTLARCARDYHERVIEPTRTTKHGAQWIASLEHHVPPALWHKPIAHIEAPELLQAMLGVRSLEDKNQRIPETLQRVRQRLEAVFEDAQFHKRCTTNPALAIRRKMREAIPKKQSGQFAALPYREAPAFMARLREAEGVAARCLEFAVLTAARTSEALLAEWSEIDLDAALWVVPAAKMKAGEEHFVQMSSPAVGLLRQMQAMKLHPRWVFPSPMKLDRPMSNMAMLTVLGRMKMRDRTTVHGLCRATFSTWANDTGAARPDVIEACLAHEESNRVRAAYNRAQFTEERRALLAAWGDYLTDTAQVLPFARAA